VGKDVLRVKLPTESTQKGGRPLRPTCSVPQAARPSAPGKALETFRRRLGGHFSPAGGEKEPIAIERIGISVIASLRARPDFRMSAMPPKATDCCIAAK
jgi:hypothetical protein